MSTANKLANLYCLVSTTKFFTTAAKARGGGCRWDKYVQGSKHAIIASDASCHDGYCRCGIMAYHEVQRLL